MPNPDLNVNYETHRVNDIPLAPTDFYTDKRVGNFVSSYSKYKKTQEEQNPESNGFAYYHFVASPLAIQSKNLGTIPTQDCLDEDKTSCFLIPYASSSSGQYNTPDSHKLNLAKDYQHYLETLSVDVQPFTTDTDDDNSTISISDDTLSSMQTGNPSNFDRFVDLFGSSDTPPPSSSKNKSYGVEIFAYMKFPKMGQYTFEFTTDKTKDTVSQVLLWIGDVALCEYVADNAHITGINTQHTFSATDIRMVPIRIQYFGSPSSTTKQKSRKDVLSLLNVFSGAGTKSVKVNTTANFFWSTTSGKFLYPPLYLAFTSHLENGYIAGKFKCHTNYGYMTQNNWATLNKFYTVIRENKRKMYSSINDRDKDGVKEVGKLNSLQLENATPTYYTQLTGLSDTNLPNVFSVYRMSVDSRYDKTFQVNTNARLGGVYDMHTIDPNLLTYSDSYAEFANNYPVNIPDVIYDKSKAQCKSYCNDISDCTYYYSYTHNNRPQCVISPPDGSPPIFNQVRNEQTMDEGSGILSLRNRKFKDDIKKCSAAAGLQVQSDLIPDINNINDYSANFKYSKYDLSSASIDDGSKIGICGTTEYNNFIRQAQDILYTPRLYKNTTKEWLHSDDTWSLKENMETKQTTDAKSDTQFVIQSNLNNHDILRQKMIGIDSRYRDLDRNITDYRRIHDYMNKENRYDQNGNILLYLKDKPLPTLAEINTKDSKVLSQQQTFLFYTGIITAATLIVLAVTIGSE